MTPLRRQMWRDLKQHHLAPARQEIQDAAKAELEAMDVRGMSREEYAKARRRAVTLVGRLENPRP